MTQDNNAEQQARALVEHIVALVAALDGDDPDGARETIQEDPLEVSVRSSWHQVGTHAYPEEFMILLCTGGPAVRIVGDLDTNHEPYDPIIQYQDWFEPWTTFIVDDYERAALQRYCEQFYFGG